MNNSFIPLWNAKPKCKAPCPHASTCQHISYLFTFFIKYIWSFPCASDVVKQDILFLMVQQTLGQIEQPSYFADFRKSKRLKYDASLPIRVHEEHIVFSSECKNTLVCPGCLSISKWFHKQLLRSHLGMCSNPATQEM